MLPIFPDFFRYFLVWPLKLKTWLNRDAVDLLVEGGVRRIANVLRVALGNGNIRETSVSSYAVIISAAIIGAAVIDGEELLRMERVRI